MKKVYITFLFITLYCIFLTGCGKQKSSFDTWQGLLAGKEDLEALTERTEYYDIITETEQLFPKEQNLQTPEGFPCTFLYTQPDREEPVQFWAVEHEDETMDVWLYRTDGSMEQFLQGMISTELLTGGPAEYAKIKWYIDREENYYCWRNSVVSYDQTGKVTKKYPTILKKFLASGEELFSKAWEVGNDITDFCQLQDGRVFMIMKEYETGSRTLMELDPYTGLTMEQSGIHLRNYNDVGSQMLGAGPNSLLLLDMAITGNEILELDLEDGNMSCILSFTGTSYSFVHKEMELRSFRMLEDESLVMLWTEREGTLVLCERLRMTRVEKIPITLRGQFNGDSWLSEQVSRFNSSDNDYHVILEDCGDRNDPDDFAKLTSVQMAAGKGPDILYGALMHDYIFGMVEKGALEDLDPYLEEFGIMEEDYFPFVFDTWKKEDRIYGINVRTVGMYGYRIDTTLLNGGTPSDMNDLTSAMLACPEERIFRQGCTSQRILDFFLNGSETLWGMIDWDEGTCDFSGELFARILEIALRYGDTGHNSGLPNLVEERSLWNLFEFDGKQDQEKAGKTTCGCLFDDGCHIGISSYSTMAVNANSANKEGALRFISFLLGEDVQGSNLYYVPVNKKAFDAWIDTELEKVSDGKEVVTHSPIIYAANGELIISSEPSVIHTAEDITEEKAAEYKKALEEARPLPFRTGPVLDIMKEEAENYFNGSKSVEEVAAVISNRVQLYLDENR